MNSTQQNNEATPSKKDKWCLRYFFEWAGGGECLWAGNDATRDRFDVGPIPYIDLPMISEQTINLAGKLGEWHDKSLNWDYPPDPGLWRQDECDQFNEASQQLLAIIRAELGSEYEVIDRQNMLSEDPDLDLYLQDPINFKRA